MISAIIEFVFKMLNKFNSDDKSKAKKGAAKRTKGGAFCAHCGAKIKENKVELERDNERI